MLKSHEKFYSAHGKRLILIAEDEEINRMILGSILENDYEIVFAETGGEAWDRMNEYKGLLSASLIDINMPGMSGLEILKKMKQDKELSMLPTIVMTADQEAEVECLTAGAADFISKPYPIAEVIRARVLRTIELSEDRQIIESTERDPLTGLYNKEFFYRYAEEYDHHHEDVQMDAIVIDVYHFHIINDRFGIAYGDEVLKHIGEKAREVVAGLDGIVCRREADTFMIYCPHGADYRAILDNATKGLGGNDSDNHVRLRMGVYANVDKSLDIIRRFDRAKMAADTIRTSMTKNIVVYDDKLREKELFAERLIDDFQKGIEEGEFTVFFQPKFNIRPMRPVLASAEGLVRWKHHDLGMISPGVFIPLFEENGMIQELDRFVWNTTAKQIKEWKDKLGFSVPVSVNVSRVDLYDPDLCATLKQIVSDNGLTPDDILLEITESAYTGDSEQIISTVNSLRDCGFRIEMDDFGSGYSSLNMISALPIDVLKLDMQFVRNAFKEGSDTRMLEVIIDIAGYLAVPVVAEGVETEEQMTALRMIGCDLVQGYYFSKPVPAKEFEAFLQRRKEEIDAANGADDTAYAKKDDAKKNGVTFSSIAHALSQDYFCIYYVDPETDWFAEYSSYGEYRTLGLEKSGRDFFGVSRVNAITAVFEDDREWFLSLFTKENIMAELKKHGTFTMTYRIVIQGNPTYVRMKATLMPDRTDRHIVIGVSNAGIQSDGTH